MQSLFIKGCPTTDSPLTTIELIFNISIKHKKTLANVIIDEPLFANPAGYMHIYIFFQILHIHSCWYYCTNERQCAIGCEHAIATRCECVNTTRREHVITTRRGCEKFVYVQDSAPVYLQDSLPKDVCAKQSPCVSVNWVTIWKETIYFLRGWDIPLILHQTQLMLSCWS